MILKKILTVIFIAVFFIGNSQNISGFITSEENIPLENVTVFMKTIKVASTNSEGFFQFFSDKKLPIEVNFQKDDYYSESILISENGQTYILKKIADIEVLDKVQIVSNFKKNSDVIVPTSEVTAAQIENFSTIDLVNVVNQTPGVYIQSGAINTNRITIRGVGSRTLYGTNKIRAYYNGIPITNGVGETSIDVYNPEDLQNIEIVKGPKATLYGTNLGGTLLLNSKENKTDGFSFKNKTTLGSYNLLKNSVSSDYKEKTLSIHFNYDHLETTGFRENSDYNRNSYLLTSSYKINPNNEIGFLFNQNNTFAEIASSISKTDFNENPTQAAFTWGQAKGYEDSKQILVGLNYKTNFSETFSNESSVYHSNLSNYEPRPFNILTEKTKGYGARTVFEKLFNFRNKQANLKLGAEWYQDNYRWKTFDNLYQDNNGQGSLEGELLSKNLEKRNNLNVFSSVVLPLSENLEVQVGLNINKTSYDYENQFNPDSENTTAERDFDVIVAPNLSLLYQFSSEKNIYGNISRGFNYPSLEETLAPNGLINPEIGPEIGWNYEIGTSLYFLKNKLHLQVAGYLLSISNLLVAQRIGDDQFIGKNAGKTHHRGIEIALDYKLKLTQNLEMTTYLNSDFSFHKFVDFIDGENDFSGKDLTGVPDKKINVGIRFDHNIGLFLLGNLQHIGSQPLTDSNSLFSDSYTVMNLKGGFAKQLSKAFSFEITGGINNFSDEKYASSILINASAFGNNEPRYYYPGNPRNYFASLSLKYQL